jgi:hypothetical protein
MRGSRFLMAIVVCALLAMTLTPAAMAGTGGSDRPLQASAAGYGYWPGPGAPGSLDCPGYAVGETTFVYLEGTMAHLGRVHVEMRHCTFYPDLGEFFTDTGVIDIVAANGDLLHGTYATWLTDLVGDQLTSGFEISFDGTGSSGRFAGATGSADGEIALTVLGYEVNPPIWPATSWQIAGTITY